MKKYLQTIVAFFTFLSFSAQAQVIITSTGTPYNQDFNTLASTGSSNVLPTGWNLAESGTNANDSYVADAGGTSSGNSYSYGGAGNIERALGSLRSSSLIPSFGAKFTNNSGETITSLNVVYYGEQWRLGSNTGRKDTLKFKYSVDATDLTTGTWNNVPQLDFATLVTTTNGVYDGNATANRSLLSYTITGLNIANGSSFLIRWDDIDAAGADDGLAIDDLIINFNNNTTPVCTEPINQATGLILTAEPTSINGTFTAAIPPVNNYLIVRSTNSSLSASPVDGVTYIAGQSLGGGTIISIGSANTFTDAGLNPTTTYYYFVFAINDEDCLGGPNYLSTNPLTGSSTTLTLAACVAPTASATALILTPSNNTIQGSFTASASANRYLIVRSNSSSLGATPVNGTTYTEGQTFGNGIVVTYTSNTLFTATGLSAGTTYYFFVFAANGECSGEPFYRTTALTGNVTTTNSSTGIPTGYYNNAEGKTCAALKTALKTIISANTTVLSYSPGVWNAINAMDVHKNDANTKNIIWDMYTDNPSGAETYEFVPGTDQCGTYSKEGDCYNREHSFPKEWFGGDVSPMVTDIQHIYATDGYVNGKRASLPYGEVATNPTYTSVSNKSKIGTNTSGCYTGTVFEPIDAYKGDLARTQLYMITRYEDKVVSWKNNADAILNGTTYPALDDWYIQLLIKWHNQDPVSQKEIDRNNAAYAKQGNRNPFIDRPEFVQQMFQCVTYTCTTPVRVINIEANKINQAIYVNWAAENEINVKYYIIERSVDGSNFVKVGEVNASNASKYGFTDNNLPTGTVAYYRLKTIDNDGKTNYNKIVSVRLSNTKTISVVYPNPVKTSFVIKLQNALSHNSVIKISDIAGRVYMTKNVLAAQNNIPVNVEQYPAGRYFITIENSGELIHDSFIITK